MGVSEQDLKYPELDRVDGADSSSYLSENIKLKNDGSKIEDILKYTKSENIQEAVIQINDRHRDLEVSILPLNQEAYVQIEHRPTNTSDKESPKQILIKDKQALIPIFDKLAKLYGIKFNYVTTAELTTDTKFTEVTDAKHTNAFILNGEIYINMDVADVDAPIHEMSHLMLGSIKFQNPELYQQLVNLSEQFPSYSELVKNYPARTRSDINEEIFVTEFAKFIANKQSIIQELPLYIQEEMLYNVKRLLDSMLMGDVSVKTIPTQELMQMSFFDIAELVNSNVFVNNSRGSLDDSYIHRILNNRKSDLMNKNELVENCQ